jgi:hypothetical protein
VKVYCKRTKFFDDGSIKWKKDCWYSFEKPLGSTLESEYLYGYVDDKPISIKNFKRFFWTQEEIRDIKIKEILN